MRDDIQLSNWEISAESTSLDDNFLESIFFIGNGRMGARGYSTFAPKPHPVQMGLFVAGIFDEIKQGITDFVNLPTPIWEQILIDGQTPTLDSKVTRTLDLSCGLLMIQYTLAINGKKLDIIQERFFPLEQPSLIMQRTTLIPQANMQIEIESGVLTASCNCPIPDDQVKENNETIQLATEKSVVFSDNRFACEFETHITKIVIKQEVAFKINKNAYVKSFNRKVEAVGLHFAVEAENGKRITIEKASAITTSRDKDPLIAPLGENWSYEEVLKNNKDTWNRKWNVCDIEITGDANMQTALRYCIYQLIVNCSARDDTVSIGARGLTHTRYKGCYFWDTDFFIMPFYLFTDPNAAKSLMQFRVNTLPQARLHAEKMNNAGARYPWMVSYDGTEQCESWDIGASELHVTADIVYAIDQYIEMSGDQQFYKNGAAEVYIETARFWKSRYTLDNDTGIANLLFCKGPDEYCGITNNNLFTNVLVQKNLTLAINAANYLKQNNVELYSKLGVTDYEVSSWKLLYDSIKLPKDPQTGRYRTDDTFHLLEPVETNQLKPDLGASYHHVCFDRLQRYKVVKQADVLLLMSRLPKIFTEKEKLDAWNDFEPLCLHDSTLSFASHALFAAQNGLTSQAFDYFKKALFLDIKEIMGNTGKEGLHLAGFGETWQAVILGFAGLSFVSGEPTLSPNLPTNISKIEFKFYYKNTLYAASIDEESVKVGVI